jgi:hypothetical protein
MEQSSDIKSEIRRLRCLKQYKSLEDAQLEKLASKNIVLRELVSSGNFINDAEKKQAKILFASFLDTHDFESTSDLNTLSMLIFQMVLVDRIQKALNDCTTKDGKSFISDKLTKSLSDATNQVLSLKLKLHIDNEDKKDDLTVLQLLKRRFHDFINCNKNEFTCVCAKCGNILLLRRRVANFDVMVHPQFSGRWYFNQHAIQMVKDGRMTREDYAKIFSTSVDYVQWCLDKIGVICPTMGNE